MPKVICYVCFEPNTYMAEDQTGFICGNCEILDNAGRASRLVEATLARMGKKWLT